MDPLTLDELDKFKTWLESETNCNDFPIVNAGLLYRLIAAARASIPRPIADAPRDGTYVDVWDEKGNRYPDSSFINGEWCDCEGYVFSVSQQPVSFLPILKGGVS